MNNGEHQIKPSSASNGGIYSPLSRKERAITDERYGCYTCGTIRSRGQNHACKCGKYSFDWAEVPPASHYANDLRGHREGRYGEDGINTDILSIDSALSAVRVFRYSLNRGAVFDSRYGPVIESVDRVVTTLISVREDAGVALKLLDAVQAELDAL